MENIEPWTTGLAGLLIAGVVLVIAVVWLVFPFLVLGALKRQQKAMEEIARNTKAAGQPAAWRERPLGELSQD